MNNSIKFILISLLLVCFIVIYFLFDPSNNSFFPKCPLLKYTGLKCPGCGSQRAIHYLLHFNIKEALSHNLMMVISIPYILGGYYFELKKKWTPKERKIRNFFYSINAIIIVFVLVVVYWIARNFLEI
jgi:hypothetical protein